MRTQESIVRCREVDLATRIDGVDGRPWLVLSNSLATTHEFWSRQIAALTPTHRVLRYDTRGHGKSGSPTGPYSFADLTADVIGLMDHFRIERADLMGMSMGGMTMLGLAIERPERVHRAICCDARSDAIPPYVAGWDSRIAAIRVAGVQGIVELSMGLWFTPAFRERNPDVVRDSTEMILSTTPEGYIACSEALKRVDYKRSLGKIRAPTLYVCGAQDPAATPAVMREMAELTPGAEFALVDPGAHICNIENPDAFNEAVAGWLARTPIPAAA